MTSPASSASTARRILRGSGCSGDTERSKRRACNMLLHDLPPVWIRAVAAGLGLIWGSFLNVVIHRVPREMSVVRPGSTCPSCGKPIAAFDNIPVVSWLILRGRARCCRTPISARYPLVELLCGFVGLAIVDRVIQQLPADTTAARAAAIFVA